MTTDMRVGHPGRGRPGAGGRWRALLALLAVLAMVAAACGSDDETSDSESGDSSASTDDGSGSTDEAGGSEDAASDGEPVTISWWHIQNNDPMLSVWQDMADEYMADNPNVTIEITTMENEAFKSALQANLQAGDVPDLFQSWGAAGLREQAENGLVQDITEASSDFIGDLNPAAVAVHQVDGKQYSIPFNMGMVGFWYNKDLFEQAGIEGTPETWDDFLDVVQKLEDAGITPIAVGAGDKWPAHFYYSYLMLRIGGQDAMEQVSEDGDWTADAFVSAGEELQRLIDLEPFQAGFLSTPWDGADGEAGYMGSGQAAMDLMGQWAAGSFRNASPDGEGIDDVLGWFPFPTVEGGAGEATDAFGGVDGFAVGKDAPPEAVDFLRYISAPEQAMRTAATGSTLPVTAGSEDGVEDPIQRTILDTLNEAGFVQIYLDQYFTPDLGAAINDAVQTEFAGQADATQVAEAITAAAAQSG